MSVLDYTIVKIFLFSIKVFNGVGIMNIYFSVYSICFVCRYYFLNDTFLALYLLLGRIGIYACLGLRLLNDGLEKVD